MGILYEEARRITYYDLDYRGKLKLSAFLRMVHIAADANANALGIGHRELFARGMSFVLQRFGLDIKRMPEYDETVAVRTWPAAVSKGAFTRKGDMKDKNGNKLMEWTSLWILFDIQERKILRPNALPVMPPEMGDLDVFTETPKIDLAEGWGEPFSVYDHTVRYSEVDTNKHMNNSIYGDLIGNALFGEAPELLPEWKKVRINFLAETRLDEEIKVECRKNADDYRVSGAVGDKTVFSAVVSCGA